LDKSLQNLLELRAEEDVGRVENILLQWIEVFELVNFVCWFLGQRSQRGFRPQDYWHFLE